MKVEISIFATKLKNVAGFGRGTSDPYAVLTYGENQLGKSEVCKNTLNPTWITRFVTEFTKELELTLSVDLFDGCKGKDKPMGSATFELNEIMQSSGHVKGAALKAGGMLCVRVQELGSVDRGTLHLQLRGIKLENLEAFSKSDPFFEIQTATSDLQGARLWQPVYRSEIIKNNLQPKWNECQMSIETVCGGNLERPIQVQVFDWEKNGKHKLMGTLRASVKGLLSGSSMLKLVSKNGYCNGTLMCTKAEIAGEELDPNNAPPRFKTMNGVRGFNPQYIEWQKQFGNGASAPAPRRAPAFKYCPPK